MNYEAIIFDLDGTLVHSLPEYRYTVVGKVLDELGSEASNDEIDRFWFEARRDEIVTENFGLPLEEFWKIYRKFDTTELRREFTKPYEDINVVDELKKEGYGLGIVTGAPPHIAELEIDMIGRNNFGAIIVANRLNGYTPKPNPQGLEDCLRQLKCSQSRAVYIGNADEDILTARNAGIFDILIDREEHTFPEIHPSLTIASLYDLKNFLDS